jgi:hypothetical protein
LSPKAFALQEKGDSYAVALQSGLRPQASHFECQAEARCYNGQLTTDNGRLPYGFKYESSHPSTVWYHNRLFCGFSTQ